MLVLSFLLFAQQFPNHPNPIIDLNEKSIYFVCWQYLSDIFEINWGKKPSVTARKIRIYSRKYYLNLFFLSFWIRSIH